MNRLGDLLGNAKIQVPVTPDNAAIVTGKKGHRFTTDSMALLHSANPRGLAGW